MAWSQYERSTTEQQPAEDALSAEDMKQKVEEFGNRLRQLRTQGISEGQEWLDELERRHEKLKNSLEDYTKNQGEQFAKFSQQQGERVAKVSQEQLDQVARFSQQGEQVAKVSQQQTERLAKVSGAAWETTKRQADWIMTAAGRQVETNSKNFQDYMAVWVELANAFNGAFARGQGTDRKSGEKAK